MVGHTHHTQGTKLVKIKVRSKYQTKSETKYKACQKKKTTNNVQSRFVWTLWYPLLTLCGTPLQHPSPPP